MPSIGSEMSTQKAERVQNRLETRIQNKQNKQAVLELFTRKDNPLTLPCEGTLKDVEINGSNIVVKMSGEMTCTISCDKEGNITGYRVEKQRRNNDGKVLTPEYAEYDANKSLMDCNYSDNRTIKELAEGGANDVHKLDTKNKKLGHKAEILNFETLLPVKAKFKGDPTLEKGILSGKLKDGSEVVINTSTKESTITKKNDAGLTERAYYNGNKLLYTEEYFGTRESANTVNRHWPDGSYAQVNAEDGSYFRYSKDEDKDGNPIILEGRKSDYKTIGGKNVLNSEIVISDGGNTRTESEYTYQDDGTPFNRTVKTVKNGKTEFKYYTYDTKNSNWVELNYDTDEIDEEDPNALAAALEKQNGTKAKVNGNAGAKGGVEGSQKPAGESSMVAASDLKTDANGNIRIKIKSGDKIADICERLGLDANALKTMSENKYAFSHPKGYLWIGDVLTLPKGTAITKDFYVGREPDSAPVKTSSVSHKKSANVLTQTVKVNGKSETLTQESVNGINLNYYTNSKGDIYAKTYNGFVHVGDKNCKVIQSSEKILEVSDPTTNKKIFVDLTSKPVALSSLSSRYKDIIYDRLIQNSKGHIYMKGADDKYVKIAENASMLTLGVPIKVNDRQFDNVIEVYDKAKNIRKYYDAKDGTRLK